MNAIITVRIPKELKRKLDELGIDYSKEIRKFLENLVHREMIHRAVSRALEIQKKTGRVRGNFAAEFIRKNRDER